MFDPEQPITTECNSRESIKSDRRLNYGRRPPKGAQCLTALGRSSRWHSGALRLTLRVGSIIGANLSRPVLQ
ncbi:Hypothetical protein NTJ_06931 [Nesidiocoris tenuis]|uniref:Uncharacterized protein n=1 Tax=Nesidiocoris tenuis TaxID=355587 RepID=A0ABN7APH8_9HEMI|nr:Hypothetical protein NTJ_06931 [Nesidiocoris tenuis]